MEETLWKFTLWRLTRIVFTEVQCKWEKPTLPVSLHILNTEVREQEVLHLQKALRIQQYFKMSKEQEKNIERNP